MTWTYSGDPSSSNRDEVRFLIQDTDSTKQLMSDAEVSYAIANEPSNISAAIRLCRVLSMKFAQKADKSIGDLKISYSQISKRYSDLAAEYESSDMVALYPTPYAGGISISDKDSIEDDSDRVNPSFKKGMHDNPNSVNELYDTCDDVVSSD